jgi:hypothetical protein
MSERRTVNLLLTSCALGLWIAALAGPAARAEDNGQSDPPKDPWSQIVPRDAADDAADRPAATAAAPDQAAASEAEPDWNELGRLPDIDKPAKALRANAPRLQKADASSWSRNDQGNGTSSVGVKTDVSPFWSTRAGINMNVIREAAPATIGDSLIDRLSAGSDPKNSSGTAWASATAPGVPYLWDKTGLEVSMDSRTDQSKLGTTLSKSLPLWRDQFALTLENGYRLTQQSPLPLASPQTSGRSLEVERNAKFSINQTGTSVFAGQTLSSNDEKWLGKVGAEQKLFGGVSVTGTLSETASGATSKSVTAGFKKSW